MKRKSTENRDESYFPMPQPAEPNQPPQPPQPDFPNTDNPGQNPQGDPNDPAGHICQIFESGSVTAAGGDRKSVV